MDGPAPEQQSAPAQAEVPPVAMFRDRCQALRGRLNQLGVCSIDVETTVENDTNAAMLDTITKLLRLHDAKLGEADARREQLTAAEREISAQTLALESLRDEVSSAEEVTRKWRLQLDMTREEHRAEKSKLVKHTKALEKERAKLQGKDSQYTAKLRKVEGEVSRLKDQLLKAQNPSKGRKDRGGIAMVRVLPANARSASSQRAGGGPTVSESQRLLDEAHEAYTATLSELRSENKCLRASLQTLLEELTDAWNDAVTCGHRDVKCGADRGPISRRTMMLPVDLMQDGMEQQILQLVQNVRELLTSAAAADDHPVRFESPSLAQQAAASVTELRDQLVMEKSQSAGLQATLTKTTDRLAETERMCALLRDAAHKQLGASEAAEAIKLREEACDQRERALEAKAAAVVEQAQSNAVAAEQIDRQRAVREADTAAVAASLSAWERGSVGADGTPLALDKMRAAAGADASPYVEQFLRRLSGISAPSSASKGSPAVNSRSSTRNAKTTITPHKTSTTTLPVYSPKAMPLSELNKQFSNAANHCEPKVFSCQPAAEIEAGAGAKSPDIESSSSPALAANSGDVATAEDEAASMVATDVAEEDFSKLMAAAGISSR